MSGQKKSAGSGTAKKAQISENASSAVKCLSNHVVFGIHLTNRVKNAPQVQQLLTQFGCSIKTRIGLHEVSEDFCSPNGLILLEMTGDRREIDRFHEQVAAVAGVQIQKMEFTH